MTGAIDNVTNGSETGLRRATDVEPPAGMKVCGYALRNWINFLAIREVYFHMLTAPKKVAR